MSRIESKSVSIMEDKELSKLVDVVKTVLADDEALNNSLEDLESKSDYEKIQTTCTKDIYVVSPGHHTDLYRSTSPSELYRSCSTTIMNQVQNSLASLRLEMKRYQDILFGIKDGIVQVSKHIVDNPLSLNKEVRRNKITKYHKFRRALASSENLMRLSDGGAISTWPMDEWLVVEKVRSV